MICRKKQKKIIIILIEKLEKKKKKGRDDEEVWLNLRTRQVKPSRSSCMVIGKYKLKRQKKVGPMAC
jgi:hypothetical protein